MRAFRRRRLVAVVPGVTRGRRLRSARLATRAGLVGLFVVLFGGGLLLALGGAAGAAHERDARARSLSTSIGYVPAAGKFTVVCLSVPSGAWLYAPTTG